MKIRKKILIPIIIVAVLVGAAIEIYFFFGDQLFAPPVDPAFVRASGRIEGRMIDVGSKLPGRVVEILVSEGQTVSAGDLLARISTDELDNQLAAALADQRALLAQKKQIGIDVELTQRQINSGIESAEARVGVAEASLMRAEASEEQALADFNRSKGLYDDGVVAKSVFEHRRLAWLVAQRETEVARRTLTEAQTALRLARESRLNISLKREQLAQLEEQIAAAEAQANLVRVQIADAEIRAPIGGVVLDLIAELGEVIGTGSVLLTMVNPDDLYMKIYVPTTQMNKLRIGDQARIYPDGMANFFAAAQVTYISERAEFTPKNVETKQQRTSLVFEVRLGHIENVKRQVKPGMSAESAIRLDDSAEWTAR